MPPSDPNFVDVPADEWTPVAVDTVSVTVNILEAFADLVYYQTYRPTGGGAPDNTPNPGDVDFEGVPIFNRRDRIAGKDVFVGGVDFQTSAGIDVYIYPLEKAGKVRVDSLAAGGDGGGAVTSVDTRVGDVTLGDLYETLFSKNTAFNKNFGSGAGQVAEGNALAVKITGPGSSQINQIFVAVDANGNAKMVPVKIDSARNISVLKNILQDGVIYGKLGWEVIVTDDGTPTGNIRARIKHVATNKWQFFSGPAQIAFETGGFNWFRINPATQSTDKDDGALVVIGGAGIAKNVNVGGDLGVVGDIKTVPWTDYGGTSTIVGFSSITTRRIWYKKVGNLVFVNYLIFGASNAVNFTFTLPFSSSNSTQYITRNAAQVRNNGTAQANSGHAKLPQNSNIVTIYLDWAESAFSAAGGKGAEGQFWYETA